MWWIMRQGNLKTLTQNLGLVKVSRFYYVSYSVKSHANDEEMFQLIFSSA